MRTASYVRRCATLVVVLAASVPLDVSADAPKRPNILLVVVDDMGYSDIGPFGGEIRTPNLDALAKSGVVLTDFHTAPTCSPTRSMLLSGTDNHLAGLGSMAEVLRPNQQGQPGYEGYLNDRVVSIATGPAWAQASMTPYRMFKGFPSEGGIRSPLIVGGPGVARPGTRSDAFTHVMDVAATILDAAGVAHPGPSTKGRKVHPLRGRSILPLLSGKADVVYKDDTAVGWELFGLRAVRKGDYKLLWLPKPFGTDDWQLYDLSADPAELTDLSQQRPKLRAEMIDIWSQYAEETGVVLLSEASLSF